MSALQRHTLCWLESAELRLIARQLNGAFSALPASLREELRDYLLSGYLPGIVRRGIRDEASISPAFAFRSAGKGSVYGWRRLLHYRPSRACQHRNKRPSCLPSTVPARYAPLAPCVRRGVGRKPGLACGGRWRWR